MYVTLSKLKSKKSFIEKALSLTKPKEIWRIIYWIIKPNPKPVRLNENKLNKHFASTAHRPTGIAETDSRDNLFRSFVDTLETKYRGRTIHATLSHTRSLE